MMVGSHFLPAVPGEALSQRGRPLQLGGCGPTCGSETARSHSKSSVGHRPGLSFIKIVCGIAFGIPAGVTAADASLEDGFRSPPPAARPHTYWLWLNGHVHLPTAAEELHAMKAAGLGGVLLFEMGARGDAATIPPPGPAFLSAEWTRSLRTVAAQTKALGLQLDMSVISSWDMGGPWIEPKHAVMGLYSTEATVEGGRTVDLTLPFPTPEPAAPLGSDGRPAFWTDVAVLAVRDPQRLPGHDLVLQCDPVGDHALTAVALDQGDPRPSRELAATMTPVRDFSIAVSNDGSRESDFTEVLRGTLESKPGPQRFTLPPGTRARFVRLRMLSGHHAERPRWTLGEFEVFDTTGSNLAASHYADEKRAGALLVREPVPFNHTSWSAGKVHDGRRTGPASVFATAGRPGFDLPNRNAIVDVTASIDKTGRLRWEAPPGRWTILRYVCMLTGEKLKVPSPASDGLASDHLNPEATRLHMTNVIARLRAGLGDDLSVSGIENLYLASYEVVGRVWSPVFAGEFKRRRGYELAPWLPTIFGARVAGEEMTERFRFDYRKTLGEVVVDAYYRTAAEVARDAGLKIKSEAGGPGPPIHTPPIESLQAYGAIDNVQGEFWPFWPNNDAINVIKEPASAAHLYGKRRVHLEAFTSFHHWAEGPQDLKPSADRVFTEGGNHFVWHTWTHQPPDAGLPGLVYGAGTHLNRSVTWWPKAKPFLDYLARGSFLLQRGQFVADVLYYYGDGGANFVGPRRNPPALGPGYDYDAINAEVILNRLTVRDGRLTLPDGMNYAVLVLPNREDIHPLVLEKIDTLVRAGATVIGPRPTRATGLEGFPANDARVREQAVRLWGDLDGRERTGRKHGAGSIFNGVPERRVLAELGIKPDFVGPEALDFTHRRDAEGEIYFVRNRTDEAISAVATFRDGHDAPTRWDPMSGRIEPVQGARRMSDGVVVPIALAPRGSTFVVFRTGETRKPAPPAPPRSANLPAPIALDREWTVAFSSPLGAPAAITLPEVAPWTRQSAPELRYFSGSGKYRRTITLPTGWRERAGRVELDLGRLWAIGEVWINGTALGVVWAPPFKVECTQALRDGENEIVIEVVGTWHNRLVGEARGALPKGTRTNITVSQKKAWKELEPVEAGLFGPVRLVPQAVEP